MRGESDYGPVLVRGLPAGDGPLTPLTYEALPVGLRAELAPRARRLGYVGAFFAYAGRQPDALHAFHLMTECLKMALPDDLVEVVALTVATHLHSEYERTQHERLALKQGQSSAWIEAAKGGTETDALSTAQRAVRALAERTVASHGQDVRDELAAVVELIGEDDAVGVLMLVGRYVAHAHISNAIGLTAPV